MSGEWPDKVKIDGWTWTIHVSERKPRWVSPGAVGMNDPNKRRIWVDAKLSEEERHVALAHELLHAVLPDGTFRDELEEAIVTLSEKRLTSLLRDNDLSFFWREEEE